MTEGQPSLHASLLVIGEEGILIRGASGAGKSSLALGLVEQARSTGHYAALVADDRVILRTAGERLIGAPHPALEGKVEMRMLGIVDTPTLPACIIALCIDLVPGAIERMPLMADRQTQLLGCALPRLALPERICAIRALPLVLAALPQ